MNSLDRDRLLFPLFLQLRSPSLKLCNMLLQPSLRALGILKFTLDNRARIVDFSDLTLYLPALAVKGTAVDMIHSDLIICLFAGHLGCIFTDRLAVDLSAYLNDLVAQLISLIPLLIYEGLRHLHRLTVFLYTAFQLFDLTLSAEQILLITKSTAGYGSSG